jgi:type I restriction enzyme S subunit
MKRAWPKKRLADVILDIKDGGTPSRKNPQYFGGDVYWCVVKDIKPLIFDTAEKLTEEGLKNCSAKVWPIDSVIISLGATIGQIGIAKVPTATKQGLAGIVPNRELMTPEFLAYGLLDQKEYIQSLATGATIKEIRPTRFAETIQISLPPLPEQHRIVAILDKAFDGIATAKANAEKNVQNARALFESHLQSVFTERGEGWVEKPLEEVCVIGDGNHSSKYPRKEELVDVGVPFIRATNLIDGRISGEDMRFLSPEKHTQLKKGHLKSGDILITNRGEIGKTAIVDAEYDNANLNSQIAWLRCRDGMNNRFLFQVLNSSRIQQHFVSAKSGAALQQFTIKQLKALIVPVPPLQQQAMIVNALELLSQETQRLESIYQQKLIALDDLKKSMLHQAFMSTL